MEILLFLMHLFGATMLLLYAVRMVRTGIERAYGAGFRRIVTRGAGPVRSAASGLGLAIILQSSAAVTLLVAGFAGAKMLAFPAGLAVVLGADLGSALLIQILSFPLDWVVPFLLGVGGVAFVRSNGRKAKQIGRIILGIAFILISLRFLREAMDPIRDSAFLPAIIGYLEQDFVTAFIVGAVLAFVMHSSVAVILICVTLVSIGSIPVTAGVSLVLGANLGSAFVPIWLSRGMSPAARRIPLANLALRGSWAITVLFVVNHVPLVSYISVGSPGQTLVNAHIAFNISLLVLALPFTSKIEGVFVALLPDVPEVVAEGGHEHRSALDPAAINVPALALTSLRREALRMVQLVEAMFVPVMDIFETGNKESAQAVVVQDRQVNLALDGCRRYLASLPLDTMSEEDQAQANALMEYAIAVETAGDIVVKQLVTRAMQKSREHVTFSKEGARELQSLHEQIVANFSLAQNVLVSDDLEIARLLLEEKTECAARERSSRQKHLARLQAGAEISFESSNIHLETLRALKNLNSQIASVAYPVLIRGGQLLETRLIDELETRGAD